VAGEQFSIEVRAKNANNETTTNFNIEEMTGALEINHTLDAPISEEDNNAHDGELTVLNSVIFIDGVATIEDAQFSEVGIITIDVELSANQYLNHTGSGSITGSFSNVGPFIPAQFSLKEDNVSDGCSGSGFTYFGQPFSLSYKIEAQNLQGDVVKNYFTGTLPDNTFAKATIENLIENEQDENHQSASNLALRYSVTPSITPNWVQGVYSFNATNAVLERDPTALANGELPSSPMTQVHPLIRLTDPDGKNLNDLDQNANAFGGSSDDFDSKSLNEDNPLEMRFGRLVVGDNYGSETESLQIPLKVEYWDGTSFGINTLDSCTGYYVNNPDIQNIQDEQEIIGTDGTFSLGDYLNDDPGIELGAPNEPGVFQVIYDAPESWLQFDWNGDGNYNDANDNPSGVLRFGTYRGYDGVIYWREN
jgi:MSHA biogenesis protein MshQ